MTRTGRFSSKPRRAQPWDPLSWNAPDLYASVSSVYHLNRGRVRRSKTIPLINKRDQAMRDCSECFDKSSLTGTSSITLRSGHKYKCWTSPKFASTGANLVIRECFERCNEVYRDCGVNSSGLITWRTNEPFRECVGRKPASMRKWRHHFNYIALKSDQASRRRKGRDCEHAASD